MKEGENSFVSFAKFIENDPKKDDVTCVGNMNGILAFNNIYVHLHIS